VQAIVIGGGISGLCCAYRLRELGDSVMLLEASDRVGGVIQSVEREGFLFEHGPQSFLATEFLSNLIRYLNLEGELLLADPAAPRYILKKGLLHAAPLSPSGLLTTSLLSIGTRYRIISEPLRKTRPPEADESVAGFVRRKFGADLLENLVGPFVSGVYAGDPEKLSLRSAFPQVDKFEREHGSVIRGAIKSRPPKGKPRPGLASFRHGVATLVSALAQTMVNAIRFQASALSLNMKRTNTPPRFELQVSHGGASDVLSADTILLTVPTPVAAQIASSLSPRFSDLLARIEYAPVAVVSIAYRREQVGHPLDGFGFLVPRGEGVRLLGTVWNSSLFPGRAPEGHVLLTSFVGGATDPAAVQLGEDALVEMVERELAQVLRIQGKPAARMVQRYEQALPQYNLGHGEIVAGLREEMSRHPGFFLSGNYFAGPSIGNCVEQAYDAAEAAHRFLVSLR
jgi:oxygen-dependent protoporphyrinogen oxidase